MPARSRRTSPSTKTRFSLWKKVIFLPLRVVVGSSGLVWTSLKGTSMYEILALESWRSFSVSMVMSSW
ncbi:hypothetical protein D3C87_1896800 [compost metagenome]